MRKVLSPKTALDRAQWLCSQREKCVSEIKLNLFKWGIEAEEGERIIASLIKDGFIDEARYALAFAREKARFNGWGPRKIQMALRAKAVPQEHIGLALEEIQEFLTEENIVNLLQKKSKTIKYKDVYDFKSKLLRFALSRGFHYEQSLSVVEQIVTDYFEENK